VTGLTEGALRLGTRRSPLAMIQSRLVADAITARTGRAVELVQVTTHGDSSTEPLTQIGGTGVFVNALREALLAGEVDLAVHSLKDLPTAQPEQILLAAIPLREDPRDALVARDGLTLGELPTGSRVGTGSPRRAAQLRALGLGLEVVAVRGNVDTRIGLVSGGELDAVVLARAGLARLGRLDAVTEVIDPIQMLPAPGQGALAVECRGDAAELVAAIGLLDDTSTRCAVTAERALLAALEAGCTAPVGALATVAADSVSLEAVAAATDGSVVLRRRLAGSAGDPTSLGRELARLLLDDGAAELVDAVRPPTTTPSLPFQPSPERAS